jgi:hypothetical protein
VVKVLIIHIMWNVTSLLTIYSNVYVNVNVLDQEQEI